LESYRVRYDAVISKDFPRSLFSPAVDQILNELKAFGGNKDLVAEARGLAEQIELDRRRFGTEGPRARSAQELLASAVSSKPEEAALEGRDETEQVWLNALRKGSSLAEFDRFWRPCFRRDVRDPKLYHRTGIRPCMVRSHYAEIQSVRFHRGKIAEVIQRTAKTQVDAGPK